MIVDAPQEKDWVWIYPIEGDHPANGYRSMDEFLDQYGKLLFYAPKDEVERLAREVDVYVELGLIDQGKYSKKRAFDLPDGDDRFLLCVYCPKARESFVRGIMSGMGVNGMVWKYERQTHVDWSKNGKLKKLADMTPGDYGP